MAPRARPLPLVLAIDGDRRQRAAIAALVRERVAADLCQAACAEEAIARLRGRVPDLILTSPLLSPRDDDTMATHLRALGERAAHVQAIRIPLLRRGAAEAAPEARGFIARLLAPAPEALPGCDPQVFADEIVQYLARVPALHEAGDDVAAGEVSGAPAGAPAAGDEQTSALDRECFSAAGPTGTAAPFTLLSLEEFLVTKAPATVVAAAPEPHRDDLPATPAAPRPVASTAVTSPVSVSSEPDGWTSDPVLADFQDALFALELDVGSAQLTLVEPGHSGEAGAVPDPLAAFASEADLEAPAALASIPQVARDDQAPRTGSGPQDTSSPTPAPLPAADELARQEWTESDTPMQDEWGLFDPERCGFAALVARLNRFSRGDR